MAEPTSGQDGSVKTGEVSTLEQQANSRLAGCRTWKSYIELDLKECYFFAAPNRQRQISSMVMPSQARMLDAPELNTDEAFIQVQDFITEIANAFMPEAEPWCERDRGMFVPQAVWDKIKDQVAEDDLSIFNAIKASNFYAEMPKAFYPDLAIGTAALWIDRPHPSMPITCSAVPLRELEIDLGPYGDLDTRFAVRYTRNHYVRQLVGEEVWDKMPKDLKEKCDGKPADRTQLAWGFWRKWEDKSDEVWQRVLMLQNKLVDNGELKGEGSCPLIPIRFNPTADWPHGHGPLYQGLPTFRQVDELEYMRMEHGTRALNPSITYPDDSFAAVEQGFEEGMAYPVRPGTAADVKPLFLPPPPDAANYQYEEKLKKLRKLFFVDYPEQRGDTPPTLGQWLDEMARAQRRLGTPGMPFWREGPAQIFLRYKHLLELAGMIRPLTVDGRAVSTMPRNPAQAAAEQQEVAMAQRAIAILAGAFPEEFKMYVDGEKTMKKILDKMRVKLLVMRDKQQIAEAVDQISKLVGARHAGQVPDTTPGPAA